MALSGKQRRYLRTLAHELDPVIRIGHAGLTQGLLAELDRALAVHELVKIKVSGDSPLEPEQAAPEIASATRSEVAQIIGRILVVYRAKKKEPKIRLPAP